MTLTYIQQSGEPVGDGGDQYTGLDRFGRVIDQRWLNGSGAALDRIQYGFDRASNRLYRANVVAEAASANQDEYYTYDTLNQLLTLQRGTLNSSRTDITGTPAAEEDFTFDPTGNWDDYQTKASGSVTLDQSRTHNPANEITGIDSSSATIGQDAAGNVTKAPKPGNWGAANTLVYDAWNRLVKVKDGSTVVATYAYDGQNRRTTKATGSTRHYYYTPSWQIVEERTGTTADRQNVWGQMGLDNLILRDRGTERFYLTSDVFNATAIVDTSGSVQERYGYAAFGQPSFMDASFGSRSTSSYDWETLYGDYRYDSESGYYQVRYRFLHPTLGRWLARDPIEYQGGINLYGYVKNRAISYLDPFGLWCRDNWSGGWKSYTGNATAESGDTLSGLAQLITGRASDWTVLGISSNIQIGQKVNIAPLLVVLEGRLRANVIAASGKLNADFGGHGSNIPSQPTASATVTQFFGTSRTGSIDCLDAIMLVMADGLINTLQTGEFDKLGWAYDPNPKANWLPLVSRKGSLSDMFIGDGGYFQNYKDIPSGWAIQGQNILKVGADSYWGFGFPNEPREILVENYAAWMQQLVAEYKSEMKKDPPSPLPPGFTGMMYFLDTAAIGMKVFDLRKK